MKLNPEICQTKSSKYIKTSMEVIRTIFVYFITILFCYSILVVVVEYI